MPTRYLRLLLTSHVQDYSFQPTDGTRFVFRFPSGHVRFVAYRPISRPMVVFRPIRVVLHVGVSNAMNSDQVVDCLRLQGFRIGVPTVFRRLLRHLTAMGRSNFHTNRSYRAFVVRLRGVSFKQVERIQFKGLWRRSLSRVSYAKGSVHRHSRCESGYI